MLWCLQVFYPLSRLPCNGDSIPAWSIPKKCPESSVPLACRFTTGDFILEMFTLYTRCSRCFAYGFFVVLVRCSRCFTYGFFVVLVTGLGLLSCCYCWYLEGNSC